MNPANFQQTFQGPAPSQPVQTFNSAAVQQSHPGNNFHSNQPVAPAFVQLAPPDPFAPCFGISQPYNNMQCQTASHDNTAVFGLPIPEALSIAVNYSPVPHYIVDFVVAGRFIDLTLLLPSNLDKLPKMPPSQVNLSHLIRSELSPIKTFSNWISAWAVYMGIFAKKSPERV